MDIKSILVYIFFMVHFSNANILTDWYSSLNKNINKAANYGEEMLKSKGELYIQPAKPTPKSVYKPVEPLVEKKEKELQEICNLTLKKSDIVILTMVMKEKRKAFEPIFIDPKTLELSFRVEKGKKVSSLIGALSTIKVHKKFGLEKIPINLQVPHKILSKLPKLSNDDYVILTIIRQNKGKPAKVVSHFVDTISVAPTHDKSY
ncbi:uncharacterized protein LOC107363165 [Tetranychus urticae]|nr:uncharacterized protein LOC107363165 [Tetranychus urticae]XP_025017522.1 uncharacterized protein LOC107363165 [Tetranychus urticae]